MPRFRALILVVCLAGAGSIGLRSWAQSQAQHTAGTQGQNLLGYWYMGTMTGKDCNLEIQNDTKLRVRFGGCFSTGPWIESSYSRNGDKVVIDNPELRKELGTSLSIAKYKSNLILVPELNSELLKKRQFPADRCFWTNLLGSGGLELPKDHSDFL